MPAIKHLRKSALFKTADIRRSGPCPRSNTYANLLFLKTLVFAGAGHARDQTPTQICSF